MSTDVNINDVHDDVNDDVNDNDVEGSQKEAETEFTETPAIGNSRINLIGNGGASIEGIDAESATADTAADAAATACLDNGGKHLISVRDDGEEQWIMARSLVMFALFDFFL